MEPIHLCGDDLDASLMMNVANFWRNESLDVVETSVAGSAAHLPEVGLLLPSGCEGVLSNLSVQTGLRRAHRSHFGLSSRPPVGTSSTASI